MIKVIKNLNKNKLVKRLWKIRREGTFEDFNENDLYTKKELNLLKSQNV